MTRTLRLLAHCDGSHRVGWEDTMHNIAQEAQQESGVQGSTSDLCCAQAASTVDRGWQRLIDFVAKHGEAEGCCMTVYNVCAV